MKTSKSVARVCGIHDDFVQQVGAIIPAIIHPGEFAF
jgi:hypothetical protein